MTTTIMRARYGDGWRWCPNPPGHDGEHHAWDAGPVCDWLTATDEAELAEYARVLGTERPPAGDGRVERLLWAQRVTGAVFGPAERMTRELRERLEVVAA